MQYVWKNMNIALTVKKQLLFHFHISTFGQMRFPIPSVDVIGLCVESVKIMHLCLSLIQFQTRPAMKICVDSDGGLKGSDVIKGCREHIRPPTSFEPARRRP